MAPWEWRPLSVEGRESPSEVAVPWPGLGTQRIATREK